MKSNQPTSRLTAAQINHIPTVSLDEVNPMQFAQKQPRHLPLHIDCGRLVSQRTLGVGHVVSQLLLLHRAGVSIWLRNVNAPLRRCLQLLRLSPLFHFSDPS